MPNAAGGAADITARTVGQKIAGPLGQSVVIENKPSAGGVVAGDLEALPVTTRLLVDHLCPASAKS